MNFILDLWEKFRGWPLAIRSAAVTTAIWVLIALVAAVGGGGDGDTTVALKAAVTTSTAALVTVTTAPAPETTAPSTSAPPTTKPKTPGNTTPGTSATTAPPVVATTAPPVPIGPAGCSSEGFARVKGGITTTFFSTTPMEFTVNVTESYAGIGIVGNGKRNGNDWNAVGTISGVPLMGNLDLELRVIAARGYVKLPALLQSYAGGKQWGDVGTIAVSVTDPTNALTQIAPSPVSAGEETIGGDRVCKYTQTGVDPAALSTLIPANVIDILNQIGLDLASAPITDLHFYIGEGGELRRMVGTVGGNEILNVSITSWGSASALEGAPPAEEVGTITL